VIRGLHFQSPPAAVARIAFTTQSRIRDVALELRTRSPTYQSVAEVGLTDRRRAVVVPQGCAHGVEVLGGPAVTCHLQGGPFDSATDTGVLWDTAGVVWKTADPVVSDRDGTLPSFDTFQSLFGAYGPAHVG
jgi:dTDP-4-dehydrorhamnose 3,5-epimerase